MKELEQSQAEGKSRGVQATGDGKDLVSLCDNHHSDVPQTVNQLARDDLWGLAYQQLVYDQEPSIKHYERLLKAEVSNQADAGLEAQIQAFLELKRAQILQKQWKLQWRNKSIKIRTQVDRIVRLIMIFKDVGTMAVNADPLHAGLPWAGICFLLAVSSTPEWYDAS